MKVFLLFIGLMLFTAACSPSSSPKETMEPVRSDSDTPGVNSMSPSADMTGESDDDHSSFMHDPEGTEIEYDIGCVDRVLGEKRTDEIFYDNGQIEEHEVKDIQHCSSISNSTAKNEVDDTHDQSNVTPESSAWRPAPKDIACADQVMGIQAFRAIYQGERLPRLQEAEAWKQCLPNLPLDSIVHPLARIECPSVEAMWDDRHTYAPRWEQIECHTASLVRYELPTFRAHDRFNLRGQNLANTSIWPFTFDELLPTFVAATQEEFAVSQYEGRDLDLWKAMTYLEQRLGGNWAFMPMADFPPYIDEHHHLIVYPESDYWHDQSLRIFALHAIQRKANGHPIVMVDFYPPGMLGVPANTVVAFREWIEDVFVPQKVHEAKIAELLQAEIMFPLPIEIERWIEAQSWAATTPVGERVATAQFVLDAVYEAVRPHYKGKLDVWSYANYLVDRDGPKWSALIFTNYDEVSFHLFPECDLSFSAQYTENQLKHVMEIVNRDNLTWWIGEWDLKRSVFEELCGTNMEEQSSHIMNAMLDLIFDLPIQPIGIDFRGEIYSREQLNVIEQRIFSLAN